MLTAIKCDFGAVARKCASAGLRVFPCHPWDSEKGGKHPAIRSWPHLATTSKAKIDQWAKKWPNHNVGICTTGLVVIDVDGQEGVDSLEALQRQHGTLPRTMLVRNPVDPTRYHLYFLGPKDVYVQNSQSDIGPQIDIRGWHGFTVGPGSIHKSGEPYVLEIGPEEMVEIPQWFVDLCKTKPRESDCPRPLGHLDEPRLFKIDTLAEEMVRRFPASRGNRHDLMTRMIASLCCKTLTDDEIITIGTRWLRAYEGQYGLTFEAALQALHSCLDYTRANFEPYKPNIDEVDIPPAILKALDAITTNEDDRTILTVILKESLLDWGKEGKAARTFNVECSLWVQSSFGYTNHSLIEGYRSLTNRTIGINKVMHIKRKYVSTELGYEARECELFVRQSIGRPGKPSTYVMSDKLKEIIVKALDGGNHEDGTAGYSGGGARDGDRPAEEVASVQDRQDGSGTVPGEVLPRPTEDPECGVRKDVSSLRIRQGELSPRPRGGPPHIGCGVEDTEGPVCPAQAEDAAGGLRPPDAWHSGFGHVGIPVNDQGVSCLNKVDALCDWGGVGVTHEIPLL